MDGHSRNLLRTKSIMRGFISSNHPKFSEARQVLDATNRLNIATRGKYDMRMARPIGPHPKERSEVAEQLARNLQRLLDERGLSIPAFAKLAKVSEKTIYNIVRMSNFPQINHLDKIAAGFGVAPWQLLLGGDSQTDYIAVILALQKDKNLAFVVETYLRATEEGRRLMAVFSRGLPLGNNELDVREVPSAGGRAV
jgi:transcriptional regulator with XRE-family HTH domain